MKELSFDVREFGLALQQWHASQSDPVYAVGSSCFAGREENLDPDTIEQAQTNLERLMRRSSGSDREEAEDLAQKCGELLDALWPVTYGSGMSGCLYDNGPNRAMSVDMAVDALIETFGESLSDGEETRMREALSRAQRGSSAVHYFENPSEAGAQFCEVSF